MKHKNSKEAIRLPIFIGIALVIGILFGYELNRPAVQNKDQLQSSMVKFREVMTRINEFYVDDVDNSRLVEKAIDEMLKELDPHSLHISPKQNQLTGSQLEANYEGIGVEFNIFRDTIVVVQALGGGPSMELGIRAGDQIIKVEDEVVAGIGINNQGVIERLRGPANSEVQITIYRNKEKLEFNITRGKIRQYSLDIAYMITDNTGYIKINRFASTTYVEFKESLVRLIENGMENLILDLTGNGGGYMDQAVKIVDEFIADGKMVVYTKGKFNQANFEHLTSQRGDFEEGNLIILVDEGSASASEIVSGAIQDHDRGLILGRRTFGKGLVQNYWELSDGSQLRLTTSRYYTPSGRNIQKPYKAGNLDNYYMEEYMRYQNGEMFSKDSIKVADSLRFQTTGGRTVFGGGGIVPDHFIPIDTSRNSRLLNHIFNMGIINEYAFEYARKNGNRLLEFGLQNFIENYEVSDKTLKNLLDKVAERGIDIAPDQLEKSRPLLVNYLKAFIGRGVWDNEAFFPILNQEDEIVQSALKMINDANNLK